MTRQGSATTVLIVMLTVIGAAPTGPRLLCYTEPALKTLVRKSQENPLVMGRYKYASECFEAKLRAMVFDRATEDIVLCASNVAITNALVTCALEEDAVPLTTREVVNNVADESPSVRSVFTKIPVCSKKFPCCLFAGIDSGRMRKCFSEWCQTSLGCW